MTDDLLRRAREASSPVVISTEADGQTTIPVPEQKRSEPFPVGGPAPVGAIGSIRFCYRCGGKGGKRYEKYGYICDPEGGNDKDGNPRRCSGCNGWGYIPNVGL